MAAEKGWETKGDGPPELFVEEMPLGALALSATSLGSVVVIVFAPQVVWSLVDVLCLCASANWRRQRFLMGNPGKVPE